MNQQIPSIQVEQLLRSLRAIVALGGNLSDQQLAVSTGPKDAQARGFMYIDARHIALAAIDAAEGREG